jgi:2-isopropylmalate synthase
MERVIVFDTTLRDGEQSPGASLTSQEKVKIARQLALLGVDVIEAGFPIASEDDAAAVKMVGKAVRGPVICALSRCRKKDTDVALRSLESAEKPRLHLFLATSEIHRKYKFGKSKAEIVRIAREQVRYAKKFINDIEFSPEDASRTEPDFLMEVILAVIDAGGGAVKTINVPDTVGYAVPQQFGPLIGFLRKKVPENVIISVHCHNDLGLGVANSLVALENGARQVECTVNGIGERAGNASLEEIVMNLVVRKSFFGLTTGIVTKEIARTSKLVSSLTGIPVQPNKAIVGENAFRHEAGIHQDGVLKYRATYEIMKPEMVGISGSELVLGKHSGRHALAIRLEKLGFRLQEPHLNRVFARFKDLADKKKEITDLDLLAIAEEETTITRPVYELDYFHVLSGSATVPSATVRIRRGKRVFEDASGGDGPIDAIYKAIDRVTKLSPKLKEYKISAITGGKDAQGEVNVALEIGGVKIAGKGVSTDIIEASAKAYLNAINQYLAKKNVLKKYYRGA